MFADNNSTSEETSHTVEIGEFKSHEKKPDEIKRTRTGSIDTEYYLKRSSQQRSKCFLRKLKAMIS